MRFLNSVKALYVAVAILFVTVAVDSYIDIRKEAMQAQHLEINSGLERVVRLNRELTNMLMIAVLDQSILRTASYDTVNNQLKTTLNTLVDLTKTQDSSAEIAMISMSRGELQGYEENIIILIKSGKWKEARAAAFGDEYVLARKTNEIDIDTAVGSVIGELTASVQWFGEVRKTALGARIGALFLLLWLGIMFSRKTRADLAAQVHLRTEVSDANKLLEERVKERTEELRLLLHSVGEGIFGVDLLGKVTFVNPAALNLLGFTEEEMIGKDVHSLIHHSHEDGSSYLAEDCPMHASYAKGVESQVRGEVLWRKDGGFFSVNYSSTPIAKEGKTIGAVVAFRDVTDRKLAEEKASVFFNATNDGLMLLSPEKGFVHANAAAVELLRFETLADLLRCGLSDISPEVQPDGRNSAERVKEHITTAMKHRVAHRFDWMHKRCDGAPLPCEVTLIPIMIAGEPQLIAGIRDITERKENEEELKRRFEELDRFNRLTINREQRMIELKEEINQLHEQSGGAKKYKIVS